MVAEIYLGRGDDEEQYYFFHLKAQNGEIIASSEQYTQKHNAIDVIKTYFSDFEIKDRTGE